MSKATILSAELTGMKVYGSETPNNFREEWIGKTDMVYDKKTVSFIATVDSPGTDHAKINILDLFVPNDGANTFSGVMSNREQFDSGRFKKISDIVGSDYTPCIISDGRELSISRAKFALEQDALKYYLKYPHIYTFKEYSYMMGMINKEQGFKAPTRDDYDNYLESISKALNSSRGKFYIGKYHTPKDVERLRAENQNAIYEEEMSRELPTGPEKD